MKKVKEIFIHDIAENSPLNAMPMQYGDWKTLANKINEIVELINKEYKTIKEACRGCGVKLTLCQFKDRKMWCCDNSKCDRPEWRDAE